MQYDDYVSDAPDAAPRKRILIARPLFWAAIVMLPVVVGAVSWYLGGDDIWRWGVLGGIVLAVLFFAAFLRALSIDDAKGMNWKAVGAAVSYLALLWGIWWAVGYFLPITEVKIKPSEEAPEGRSRVTYRGALIDEFDEKKGFSFVSRGQFDKGALRIETFGPSGWAQRPFRDFSQIELEKVPTTTLYVDNRGHGAARLECGEMTLDLPARKAQRFEIMAPPGNISVPLRFDGEAVAQVNEGHYLIDVLGTRTYVLEQLIYRDGLSNAMDVLAPRPNEEREPVRQTYRHRKAHTLLHKVDYFLEKAPEKISVTTYGYAFMREEGRYRLKEEP